MGRRTVQAMCAATFALGIGAAVLVASAPDGRGQALVADLASHSIGITTGFTGAEVVLFGAIDGPGDVIVVVTGPRGSVTVRRKDRIAGVWANADSVRFEEVPGFYAVATTRPLADRVGRAVLARHEIGLEHLTLRAATDRPDDLVEPFRQSLIRNMVDRRLFRVGDARVVFLGERLFRTTVRFPAHVPTGVYTAGVFLARDGEIVSAQTTPLLINKVGISAEVFSFSRNFPALYGIFAVLGAVAIGWLTGAVFRE